MNSAANDVIDWPLALQTHRPWLMRVLVSRMGDPHAAEDAMQEISLAVVKGNRIINGQSNAPSNAPSNGQPLPSQQDKVAPWLYRLAVRQAVDFHRRRHRKHVVQTMPELDLVSSEAPPLQCLVGREQQEQFEAAFNTLPPPCREILSLKYTQKWSYQQMADHLGIPIRTVEHRLHKARTELRKKLSLVFSDV